MESMRDKILKAAKEKRLSTRKSVEVAGADEPLYVRELTARERLLVQAACENKSGRELVDALFPLMVSLCLTDEAGSPILTEAEAGELDIADFVNVYQAAAELNGLGIESVEKSIETSEGELAPDFS